jgi:hypothetical protein
MEVIGKYAAKIVITHPQNLNYDTNGGANL